MSPTLQESLQTADNSVPERNTSLPFSFRLHLMRNKKVFSVCFATQAQSLVAFFIQHFQSDTINIQEYSSRSRWFFFSGYRRILRLFFFIIYMNSCFRAWWRLHEIKLRDTDSDSSQCNLSLLWCMLGCIQGGTSAQKPGLGLTRSAT